MNLEDVLEQAANARPGYKLLAFKEAGLPIYMLSLSLLVLSRKPLGAIEEGCLRAIDAGLHSLREISEFLGLQERILTGILAGLNSQECINYLRQTSSDPAIISLSIKGKKILNDLVRVEPMERIVKVSFDPFLKKILLVHGSTLFKPQELKDLAMVEIPLGNAKRPEIEDIQLKDLDAIIRRGASNEEEIVELLAIKRIERRELKFAPSILMLYANATNEEKCVGLYMDEGSSLLHEQFFEKLGGARFFAHVFELDKKPTKIAGMDDLSKWVIAPDRRDTSITASPDDQKKTTALNSPPQNSVDEMLALTQMFLWTHHFPALLKRALTRSEKRLLIVSPWIRHQVVDAQFIRNLEVLLTKKVDVKLIYGLEEENPKKQNDKGKIPITPQAQVELDKLSKRFDNFKLHYVGNVHSKFLICDDLFAAMGSFNWLSFRGDIKDKARAENGSLFTIKKKIDEMYDLGIALIDKGYQHPAPRQKW